jgi:MFS family permease
MEFARSLRRLWRHRYFRRLLAVRVATQSADGVLQIGLASYVLFSPERQPDAAAIAAVLAITLLPFSVLGPFVSVVLDRWSRRQILVVVDLSRSVLALALAALVATGLRTPGIETIFYGVVLLAMSLNRFLLAALSASLPHTIDAEEYMVANAVVPTVGPAGILIGAGVGTTLRLVLGRVMADYSANAILFAVAAAGFVLSACLALRIPRHRLGPDDVEPPRPRDIVAGLVEALAHLRSVRAAGIGLLTIGGHRVIYGIVTVATILVYRNYFHELAQVEAAIADLGLLVAITGAGFVFAAVVTPPASARLGVRAWMIICLIASAIFQIFPGAFYTKITLGIAAFLLGLTAQNIKICVDTLVQAHVADVFKGRVFVIYDMIFNVALVLAAVIGALILPVDGVSVPILVIMAGGYLLVAVLFAVSSRGVSMDEGTESLHAQQV